MSDTAATTTEIDGQAETVTEELPAKRKRGRPRKPKPEQPEEPKPKRPRGRPKGSKTTVSKPPEKPQATRPRGRPKRSNKQASEHDGDSG